MWGMFNGASSFNQNLCPWVVKQQSLASVDYMFYGATSCESQADPSLVAPYGPFCFFCPSNMPTPAPTAQLSYFVSHGQLQKAVDAGDFSVSSPYGKKFLFCYL